MDMSPFQILPEEVAALCASPGFQVIREYLAGHGDNDFCESHETCDVSVQDEWILHRDLIHALVMPIIQLFRRASSLAQAALCSTKQDDLELAFRGDGRGTFLSLLCILSDEEDWCYSRGCPACVVDTALSTETHIRVLLASLQFSENTVTPPTPTSLTLPSFSFFLPILQDAVASDPFWGPSCWDHHSSRAKLLCTGLQDLRVQCSELEVLVESPVTSPVRKVTMTLPNVSSDIKLRKSSMARRQSRLVREEQALLQRLAYQCWGVVALPPELRKEFTTKKRSTLRRRSLTCP